MRMNIKKHYLTKRSNLLWLFLILFSLLPISIIQSNLKDHISFHTQDSKINYENSQIFKDDNYFLTPSASSDENEEENEEKNDEDGDGIDDDLEVTNQREIHIENSDEELSIQSELKYGNIKDKISLEIHVSEEGIEIELQYKSESENDEVELQFKIRFTKIIEFSDTNGNGIFNSEIDTVEKELILDNFYPITYSNIPIGNNLHQYNFDIKTTDDIFTSSFFIGEQFFTKNGVLVSPDEIKFDIRIENFEYEKIDSYLALMVELESDDDFEENETTEDEDLQLSQNEMAFKTNPLEKTGFFSWNKTALIDNSIENVSISPLLSHETENYQISYFNYKHGNIIIHDPKLGIEGILRIPDNGIIPIQYRDVITYIIIGIILAVSIFGLVMTKQEYRTYLLNRFIFFDKGVHNLSMDEVLENEFRTKIINAIIDNPGIHYNELLRKIDTSASNLAWHLDILETYKVIKKQRVGRYLVYYPYLDKNPFANFDPKLVKSKTTLDIFQLVADNPGIYQNQISKRMDLNHKTVKYHLDKLLEADVIYSEKIKGKKLLYPKNLPEDDELIGKYG